MPPDNGLTPARLFALIVEGYTAPRQSMARVLAMQPDERARLLMVCIGVAVGAMGFALFGERNPAAGQGSPVLGYLVTVLAGLLQYYGFAWLIGLGSAVFGGKGETEDNRTLVAWWALVTAPLPVVMMASLQSVQSPFAAITLVGSGILSVVLLAAYITQTHHFASTGRVCGAIMMMVMIFSFILSSILPMPVPA